MTIQLLFVREQPPEMKCHFFGEETVNLLCPHCKWGLWIQAEDAEIDCNACGYVYEVVRVDGDAA